MTPTSCPKHTFGASVGACVVGVDVVSPVVVVLAEAVVVMAVFAAAVVVVVVVVVVAAAGAFVVVVAVAVAVAVVVVVVVDRLATHRPSKQAPDTPLAVVQPELSGANNCVAHSPATQRPNMQGSVRQGRPVSD